MHQFQFDCVGATPVGFMACTRHSAAA